MKKFFSQISQHNIISLLFSPSYLSFSLSVFASQVAYNMLSIILIFLIFYLTGSNFAVAMLLFTILVPQIALSFLGGVIADKNDKKKIIIVGNFLRAAVLLLLFLNYTSVVAVYVVSFIVSAITQFYVPAEAPIIPSLVTREKLVAANSIFGISLFGSILIGYILAGPVVGTFGRDGVFLLLAAIFAIAGVLGLFIPKQGRIPVAIENEAVEGTVMSEFKSSFSLLSKTASVIDAFFLLIVSQIIIFILATLIPGYAKNLLQIPAEDLSVVIFAPAAIGMAIAAVAIGSVFQKTKKETLTAIGIFTSGIVLMLLPFTARIFSHTILHVNAFQFVVALAFAAGIGNALIFIPSQAIIQEATPENFRSKIYGLLFALIGVFSLLPVLVSGGLADIIGVGVVFFILGAAVVALGFARRRIFRALPQALRH
jgi:MFS family permease